MDNQEQRRYFQEIIERHKGILYKIAHAYCQDENDRQDLMQEIMIQIWLSINKYNAQFQESTWVYRISLNVAISFYRKNNLRKSKTIVLNENISQIPDKEPNEQEELLSQLLLFISKLKEIDKAIILLYLEEKSYKEISEIIGISETNVGTKVGRIKNKLKQNFTFIKPNKDGKS